MQPQPHSEYGQPMQQGGYAGGSPVPPGYTGQPVMGQPVYVQQAPMFVSSGQPQMVMMPQQQVMVMSQGFGKNPCGPVQCGFCQAIVTTTVTSTPGCFVWAVAAILCLVLPPCCFIPFCVPNCMDSVHSCSNCRATLGVDPGSC